MQEFQSFEEWFESQEERANNAILRNDWEEIEKLMDEAWELGKGHQDTPMQSKKGIS